MKVNEIREIGDRKIKLSRVGFGSAPIGNLYRETSDADAHAAIFAARENNISYFDTAPYYGFGLSEKRLGESLVSYPSEQTPVISSKVGRCLRPTPNVQATLRYGYASAERQEPYFDYSYDGVMISFESSLQRLGVNVIDIIYAHDPGVVTHGASSQAMLEIFYEGGYRAMLELKKSGRVNAIGIGLNECEACVDIINQVELDCILLAGRYTLLDQSAAQAVFPLCREKNIAVILGGAFNSGILATGVSQSSPHTDHNYDYAPASKSIMERVRSLERLCASYAVRLPAAAIQFPLRCEQIESVLVGLANRQEVEQLVSLAEESIPSEFWAQFESESLLLR